MATRENQTLQITLIVMTLIVLLLGVISIVLLNAKNTQQARAADLEARESQARSDTRAAVEQRLQMQTQMGFSEDDTPEAIQAQYEQDMAAYGKDFQENQRSYRTILEYIWEENRKSSQRETAAKQQVGQLTEALQALENQKEAQIEEYKKQLDAVARELDSATAVFQTDRQELEREKQRLVNVVDEQKEAFDQQLAEAQTRIQRLDTDLSKSERSRNAALAKLEGQIPNLEVPDGRVTLVDHTAGKVWIDRGYADDLRPQVTFSIYSAEENDADRAKKKGSVEVVRVLDDHMSEARITYEQPIDPILRGDRLYSQVWHPGEKQHFAITGKIDLDGDGRSDLQQLLDIIEINGGVVDQKMDEDGNVGGDMTINTRYLVLGDYPSDAIDSDLVRGWQTMTKEADTLGIDKISLRRFLDQMGWQPERKSITLGAGARSDDFPAQPYEAKPPSSVRRMPDNLLRRIGKSPY